MTYARLSYEIVLVLDLFEFQKRSIMLLPFLLRFEYFSIGCFEFRHVFSFRIELIGETKSIV